MGEDRQRLNPGPPAVTWLMTVKNGMPYLRDTLASIATQTFTDFEVLVWLIASTDDTEAELRRWIPARLPGRIIPSGPLALGPTRAALVSEARSEFCACLDADDLNSPERLEKQIAFLRAHRDIALVGSRMRVIDEHGAPTGRTCEFALTPDDVVHGLLRENCFGHSAVTFRREAVLAAGNYSERLSMVEDYDLWLRLAVRHRLANLPEYLVDYRAHAQSHTNQLAMERHEAAVLQVFAHNAPALYGLDSSAATALRKRQARCVLPAAWRAARQLARLHGSSAWRRMRTPSFLDSMHALRRYRDFVSRVAFDALDPRPHALRTTLREFGGKARARFRSARSAPAADSLPERR